MAIMGRPTTIQNKFAGIKMQAKKPKSNIGDQLNEMTGKNKFKSGIKFVDQSKHNQMGKDSFLKLLTHQLANQDPSSPMDQQKIAAELAQFASLEQLSGMNQKMDKLGKGDEEALRVQGASFLGKKVLTSGTTFKHVAGKRAVLPFSLSKSSDKLILRILDNKRQMIAQIEKTGLGKGSHSIEWDGIAFDGHNAGAGNYHIEVKAWDENNELFNGETKSEGIVTAINFENGEMVLKIDGQKKVFLRDVDSVMFSGHNKLRDDSPHRKAALKAFQKQEE